MKILSKYKMDNQIIKSATINYDDLVSKDTKLSLTTKTKLLEKLNESFDKKEQRWYIANLFLYMNYHPTDDYPINLEHVFKLVRFAHKKNAMKTLKNNFTEDEDYKTSSLPKEQSSWGGSRKEEVMLNVDILLNILMLILLKIFVCLQKQRMVRK